MVLGLNPLLNAQNCFNDWYPTRDKYFRFLLLIGASAICWFIWLTRMKLYLANVDQNLFCKFFQGNTLASILVLIAMVWGAEGASVASMLQVGDCGYAFLRFIWMTFYFKNWAMSWILLLQTCSILYGVIFIIMWSNPQSKGWDRISFHYLKKKRHILEIQIELWITMI